MAASSNPHPMDRHRVLLLETSDTIVQMARVARNSDENLENKVFYSHLASHCMRIKFHAAALPDTKAELHRELIAQTLGHLGTLIPRVHLSGSSPTGHGSAALAYFKSLNFHWNETYKHSENAKHNFIEQGLQLTMPTSQRLAFELALESCADEFEKQQAESKQFHSSQFKASTLDEPSYAVYKAADSIFKALLGCNKCTCSSQHNFDAKLELGTHRKPKTSIKKRTPFKSRARPRAAEEESADVDFGMFLSTDRDWHEIRIQAVKNKAVSFAPDEKTNSACHQHQNSNENVGKIDTLCVPIHKKKDRQWQRLILKMNKDELFEKGFEKTNLQVDTSVEPLSLAQCLTQRRDCFTGKTKRILYLILGYTVLHLHGTPWLAPGWDSNSIKFFQTTSSKTPLRPFIQTPLPTNTGEHETTDIGIQISDAHARLLESWCELDQRHYCPAVIALAVILLEIHFVMPFAQLAQKYNVELTSSPGAPISPLDLYQVFNGDEEQGVDGARSDIPDEYAPLVRAIDNCLDDMLWEDEDGNPLDNASLRSQIYREIVSPLELHLTQGFSQIPLDSIDQCARDMDFGRWGLSIASQGESKSTTFAAASAAVTPDIPPLGYFPLDATSIASTLTSQSYWNPMHLYQGISNAGPYPFPSPMPASTSPFDYRESRFFDDEVAHVSIADSTQYLSWKEEYLKVYTKFISNELGEPLINPVKIAILDTGIDRNHDLIEAREENIKGKHNLYDAPRKTVRDDNGHGTFAASLILDYAPDAELYVIKITGTNTISDVHVVAQAIRHAVDIWGVDIISMSFGWPSEKFDGFELVESAIDAAYSAKVLMFAAGSNSGGKKGRAYPASSPHVICVHSTNTYGSASEFSPTAELNAVNLATVGESVQSAWPSAPEGIASRSGTSYATPIMTGMAAFLLQYARIHLSETVAKSLKRRNKMEALLQRVAMRAHQRGHRQRDDYFFVQLSLEQHNLFGQSADYINQEIEMAISA